MSQPPNNPNGQQPKEWPPNTQPGFYTQPTSQYRQPGQLLPGQPPRPRQKRLLPLWALALGAVLIVCACAGVATAIKGNTNTPAAIATNTPTSAAILVATDTPTDTPVPTDTPTPTPTPTATPTATPTPHPVIQPTPTPRPQPTPTATHCVAVNNNPWCYNFTPGNLIYTPPSGFCSYFNCIPTFYGSDDPGDGYIIECQDATYSQSGGESGACSYHGGEMRPLYSH